MRVEYSSNNSGGSWWLKDKHWRDLEEAGWEVVWGGTWFCHSEYPLLMGDGTPPAGLVPCAEDAECHGHRRFTNYAEAKAAGDRGRWLGALAREASKDFPSLRDAVLEWERVTGLSASEEGCNCCGPPHSFSTREPYTYASGDEIVDLLYPDAPPSRRAAAELNARRTT